MTTSAIATTTHTLASAVADDGTFTVAYPTGHTQATLLGTTGGEVAVGENDVWDQDDPGFSFSFGASNITVTNKTGATLPAATELMLSFGEKTNEGSFNPEVSVQAPAALTDNSGGTASTTLAAISGTYSQTEVRNSIATLAAAIEELRVAVNTAGITR